MKIHLITERRILPKTRKKVLPKMKEMKTRRSVGMKKILPRARRGYG